MGNQNEIRLYAPNQQQALAIAQKAIDEILRVEKTYSSHLHGSLVSQVNVLAGIANVQLDDEALHIFEVADYWHQTSDGLFDITSGVLRHIWDLKNGIFPTQGEIERYLKLVNWRGVHFTASEIGLPQVGMELDLGEIIKQYAVDRAVEFLQNQGIASGLVNLGGNVRILGPHPDGSPWAIQIAHPRIPGNTLATIKIAQGALTTAGGRIQYIEAHDGQCCTTFNSKTGHPVSYWQSATFLAPVCLLAGHASILSLLLGSDAQEALTYLQLKYLLVDPQGRVIQNLE